MNALLRHVAGTAVRSPNTTPTSTEGGLNFDQSGTMPDAERYCTYVISAPSTYPRALNQFVGNEIHAVGAELSTFAPDAVSWSELSQRLVERMRALSFGITSASDRGAFASADATSLLAETIDSPMVAFDLALPTTGHFHWRGKIGAVHGFGGGLWTPPAIPHPGLRVAEDILVDLRSLADGWSGEGTLAPSAAMIDDVADLLESLNFDDGRYDPDVAVDDDGSVTVTFELDDRAVLAFDGSGKGRMLATFVDREDHSKTVSKLLRPISRKEVRRFLDSVGVEEFA